MTGTTQKVLEALKTRSRVVLLARGAQASLAPGNERRRTMKKMNVEVGKVYLAKVSGKVVKVRITGESRFGGWDAVNLATKKTVRIKSAQRLRLSVEDLAKPVAPEGKAAKGEKAPKPEKAQKVKATQARKKHTSGLDAAAQVLTEAKKPMTAKAMVETMLAKGLWKTDGKTPEATIYAAIIREIAKKGKDARFVKTGRGEFAIQSK